MSELLSGWEGDSVNFTEGCVAIALRVVQVLMGHFTIFQSHGLSG